MAGGSGRRAYFLGAIVGFVFIACFAALLSLTSPNSQVEVAANAPAGAAPEPQEPAASEPQPAPTAPEASEPEAPAPAVDEAAPTPTPAPAEPEPVEQEIALAPQDADPEQNATPAPEASETAEPRQTNAFIANAEIYQGDRSEPLLAIVLYDVGATDVDVDDVMLMPGPISLIVPADSGELENLILDARDAGFEALIGLTRDQVAGSDEDAVAASAAAILDRTGDIIGVAAIGEEMEATDVATGVVRAAAERGMAVLDASIPGGSTGYRVAKTQELPTAPNGRNFDEIQSSAMVFQALERAAFDARRTGAFVVIGRADPAVLVGLRRWMNVKANKSVNVAPLSVVIEKLGKLE